MLSRAGRSEHVERTSETSAPPRRRGAPAPTAWDGRHTFRVELTPGAPLRGARLVGQGQRDRGTRNCCLCHLPVARACGPRPAQTAVGGAARMTRAADGLRRRCGLHRGGSLRRPNLMACAGAMACADSGGGREWPSPIADLMACTASTRRLWPPRCAPTCRAAGGSIGRAVGRPVGRSASRSVKRTLGRGLSVGRFGELHLRSPPPIDPPICPAPNPKPRSAPHRPQSGPRSTPRSEPRSDPRSLPDEARGTKADPAGIRAPTVLPRALRLVLHLVWHDARPTSAG